MNKAPGNIIYKLTLITAAVLMLATSACSRPPEQACFGENCFKLELAETSEQRSQGLMFRKELSPDAGMLFIFETEGSQCFWMKNTFIPLDIIWLSRDKEVVQIAKNFPPCRVEICPEICSKAPAFYALELNAGTCDKIGLRRGDYFTIK